MKPRILFLSIFLCIAVYALAQDPRPSILASDGVFMYPANPTTQYDDYQGTVVGWGGRPRSRSTQDVERFKQAVEEAHKRGMRYCGSVDFLVDSAGFIDFAPDTFMKAVCRDLEDHPLQVPWLFDHQHKGHPAYWFCFNNPEYQKYLLDQAERVCLAPVDGLHIDDYAGTSHCTEFNGGCFCPYCMTGFREYLKAKFSADERKNMGIEDIDSFDYGQFLKAKGFTADDYKRSRKDNPLKKHFQDYQNEQMKIRISAVYEHAEKIRGIALVRSVNSSASSPRTVIPSPIIDYFCGEIPHGAAGQSVQNEPVFIYRMVEALGDRQTATASGHDWAWIKANEKPALVRAWIAQAYAYGSVFMIPHNQWCFTEELGTHWWHGKPEDFAFLYRFVRKNAALLDRYISLSNVAVLCTPADFNAMKEAAIALTRSNIPYDLVYSESPSIQPQGIRKYDTLILHEKSQSQAGWLKNHSLQVLSWNDISALPDVIQQTVHVEGSSAIRVSLRYCPQQSETPVVCHLLNQDYRGESDTIQPASVTVTLAKSIMQKTTSKEIRQAIIHEPQKESRTVDVSSTDTAFRFQVDSLGPWAIVELK